MTVRFRHLMAPSCMGSASLGKRGSGMEVVEVDMLRDFIVCESWERKDRSIV